MTARLKADARPESVFWLLIISYTFMKTYLECDTCNVAIALKIGVHIYQQICCNCGRIVDILGHSAFSCRYSAGRFSRHSVLSDVIKRALIGAGIPSVHERVGLNRGNGRRPGGMTIFPFSNDISPIWYATCDDTFCL